VQVAQEITCAEDPQRPHLIGEVVYYLYLALEDDEEVVGGVAGPEEDLPSLRLPRLPVATEDFDLVFPQPRVPRTEDLIGSIIPGVYLSVDLFARSMMTSNTV
jgi:hypothetical protein